MLEVIACDRVQELFQKDHSNIHFLLKEISFKKKENLTESAFY